MLRVGGMVGRAYKISVIFWINHVGNAFAANSSTSALGVLDLCVMLLLRLYNGICLLGVSVTAEGK
jgi:hypothetical protein